jgi:putative transposase
MGLTGIDKSAISRTCKALDEVIQQFRNRSLGGRYPFVWMDGLYLKVVQNHRIDWLLMVIAIALSEAGERKILGFGLGASETEAFWLEFLRSLVKRGLNGVQLVTSDAHEGLKATISQVPADANWQRCP